MSKNTNPFYLTIADVKNYLNISQAAAYELAYRKDFPAGRIPRESSLRRVESRPRVPAVLTA